MINVSAIMEKFKDMENSIEAKIDKTIAENYSATAVNIIETCVKEEKDNDYIKDMKDMSDGDIKEALGIDFEPHNCCIKALYTY